MVSLFVSSVKEEHSPALPPCTGSLGLAKWIFRDPSEELLLHTSLQLDSTQHNAYSTHVYKDDVMQVIYQRK